MHCVRRVYYKKRRKNELRVSVSVFILNKWSLKSLHNENYTSNKNTASFCWNCNVKTIPVIYWQTWRSWNIQCENILICWCWKLIVVKVKLALDVRFGSVLLVLINFDGINNQLKEIKWWFSVSFELKDENALFWVNAALKVFGNLNKT